MARGWSRFGIGVLLLLAAGCGQPVAGGPVLSTPVPTPTPRTGPPREAQRLSLSGDISGPMTRLVLDDRRYQNECTGASSREGGTFAWTLYAYRGDSIYSLVLLVKPYQGPGTYSPPVVKVEVNSPDAQQVWQTEEGDPATVTVDSGELTGSINATLHSAAGHSTLRVTGSWSCQP
jgi:hypothetical protein